MGRCHVLARAVLLPFLSTLSGCAAFDPFVSLADKGLSTHQCQGLSLSSDDEKSLTYACGILDELESARSQITKTQSGMVASLVPLAGLIGYNAARNINGPTNAALATGGLAAYTVGSTLAQPDRIRVYNAGITSVTCAIDIYELAKAQSGGESAAATVLRDHLEKTDAYINATKLHLDDESLRLAHQYIEVVRQALNRQSPLLYLQAQLRQSVSRTVNGVNGQLSQTLVNPTESLSTPLGVFGQVHIPQDKTAERMHSSIHERLTLNETILTLSKNNPVRVDAEETKAELLKRIDDIQELYDELSSSNEMIKGSSFAECEFKLSDASATPALSRLFLGPNDSMSGQTIALKADETRSIRIYGGIAPYSVDVVPGATTLAQLDVDKDNGSVQLKLNAKGVTPGDYTAIVGDSTGRQSKQLYVSVQK